MLEYEGLIVLFDLSVVGKSCPALVDTAWISIGQESCLSNPRFEDTCNLACRTTGYEISPSSLGETTCSGNQTWTQDVGQAQCVGKTKIFIFKK